MTADIANYYLLLIS